MKEIEGRCSGGMLVAAAFLIALSVVAGSYLLAQVDYSPKVNVSDITSTPNVYVSSLPPEHVISSSATVTKKVTPDLLMMDLRIQTQDFDAKDSQERNAVVMEDLRAELEALGIPEESIQTSYYSVQEVRRSEYVCNGNCRYVYKIVGYRTIHELTLSLEDLDKGGEVIDAATGVGDNESFVDYVYFTLKDETRNELEKELLKDAAAEAKAKAQNIAQGLGVSLGKALSASESVYYPYYSSYKSGYDMSYAMEAAPATELSSGEVEASATVNVGFEIA